MLEFICTLRFVDRSGSRAAVHLINKPNQSEGVWIVFLASARREFADSQLQNELIVRQDKHTFVGEQIDSSFTLTLTFD